MPKIKEKCIVVTANFSKESQINLIITPGVRAAPGFGQMGQCQILYLDSLT